VNLAELQRYFARAATSGSGPLPDLERVFLDSERLSASERLAIYNRSYFYRLLDALAVVFAQTKRLLGESEFERLGLNYIEQNPSLHPAVERFGRAFPEYLRLLAEPLIVDVASLEWTRLCALVAPDPQQIASTRTIEANRFPRARLRFVPSLQWLELAPNALQAFGGGVTASTEFATDSRRGVAVWRNGHSVQQHFLDDTEWLALQSAASGTTLDRVCALFDTGSAEGDVQDAFRVLSCWFARQWLESVTYDDLPLAG
jgi:hypothetical protein